MHGTALAAAPRRERLIVWLSLLAIAAFAWAYVLYLAAPGNLSAAMQDMPGMAGVSMAPGFTPWTPAHGVFIFAMWAVMMVGMMTPSAIPMVLIYTHVARQAESAGKRFVPAAWFLAGYLLAWTVFAALATLAQFALERAALLSPAMASSSRWLGVALLLAFALYQWSSWKDACLSQCRAPLAFVQAHGGFQGTAPGSVRLGWRHGLYCIGCCWALMALLFVGGVMNVLWIAAIMILVLAEKIVPGGRTIARMAGVAALGGALYVAVL